MRVFVALIFLCFNVLPALAVNPDEVLSDPALEARARALSVNLRCLVCQNQSIDDSDAELAKDLRVLVRERLVAGDSDVAVIDYIVARYGEYVLLKPRLGAHTIVLWLSPFVLLFIGIASLIIWQRRRPQMAGEALSTEEESALEDILKDR
ncbi:MAG: cytochrome c-type biogenesis protein [Hyphomicrobiales bacterium]|uniref:cytochrome c-type biogenesis protein n=1 Tax=Parasphingorhabdus sp. TaxID=2709688 RepID=UPI003297B96F